MWRLIGCITQQHDLRLVGLAACLCVLACSTTVNLMAGAQNKQLGSALAHLVAASVVFGCGVWSLHFVAMLAFVSGVPISYGLSLTFVSILIAVLGALSGLAVWLFCPSRRVAIVAGGLLLGLSVSAMHLCGVMAMQVSGTIHFGTDEVAYAVGVSFLFSMLALFRSEGLSTQRRRLQVAGLLAIAICGLHFIAMAGLDIEPGLPMSGQTAVLGSYDLAVTVGASSLALLLMSLAATLMEQHLSQRTVVELKRIRMLSDVSQEILIICRDGIILQINAAGTRLFAVSEGQLIGGRTLDLISEADHDTFLKHLENQGGHVGRREVCLNAADGKMVPAQFSIGKIDYEGTPADVIALLDLSDRKRDEARIQHLAYHDPLTDLPNRALLRDRLAHAIDTAERPGNCLALLCLDLDRFKPVNDQFGHAAGDALLTQVTKRLRESIRPSDTLARVGGDEFVVVAAFESDDHIAILARRLIDALAAPFTLEVGQVQIGVSIGIAVYPDDGVNQQELMRTADVALYRAKHEARGTFRFFETAMDEHVRVRQQLEHDLRLGVEREEFCLHYQPLVHCQTGDVEGFEALLRWRHPQRGLVSPLEFIGLAEETGLILAIGQWVLETACEAATRWIEPHWVAVNISPVQFLKTDLPAVISAVLARTGLAANRLELEITEGILLKDPRQAADVLIALRRLGVRIAMDDFGTGYSSLSYLNEFQFDKLKIDRSFVTRLGEAENSTMIVRAIIGLAHNLGLLVAAEGVETTTQLRMLRDLNCDQIQGYLLGRPIQMDHPADLVTTRARMLIAGSAAAATTVKADGQFVLP
jgi:diguanylate cyclase (GGDEF)-like protein/PAS domain S-box-containing protein